MAEKQKDYKLTEKQALFCKYYYTTGSDTFSNGVQSARKAGYKGTDGYLRMVASRNITKDNIKKEKECIQADTEKKFKHTRDKSVRMLTTDYEYLTKKAENGDSSAISARTAIIREINACCGYHSQTILTDNSRLQELEEHEAEEADRLARIMLRDKYIKVS